MRNLFTAKNPFMSLWLSSANKVTGAARGQMVAAGRRAGTAIQAETTRQIVEFWGGKAAGPVKSRRKPRTR